MGRAGRVHRQRALHGRVMCAELLHRPRDGQCGLARACSHEQLAGVHGLTLNSESRMQHLVCALPAEMSQVLSQSHLAVGP